MVIPIYDMDPLEGKSVPFVTYGLMAVNILVFLLELGFTPQTDAYGSIYFTLLGADHGHVAVGLLLDVWLLLKLSRGLNRYRLNALQAVTVYWYAVVVLTLCVTGTLLSAAV